MNYLDLSNQNLISLTTEEMKQVNGGNNAIVSAVLQWNAGLLGVCYWIGYAVGYITSN